MPTARISKHSRSARYACRSTSTTATTSWEKIADGTAGDILRMTDQMNAYPTRLGMYTNYKTLTPISDYAYVYEQNYGSSVTLAYNGKINRSRGCYVMDITG